MVPFKTDTPYYNVNVVLCIQNDSWLHVLVTRRNLRCFCLAVLSSLVFDKNIYREKIRKSKPSYNGLINQNLKVHTIISDFACMSIG